VVQRADWRAAVSETKRGPGSRKTNSPLTQPSIMHGPLPPQLLPSSYINPPRAHHCSLIGEALPQHNPPHNTDTYTYTTPPKQDPFSPPPPPKTRTPHPPTMVLLLS